MDEEVRFYGLALCTLQHAVADSKDNRRQDKQVERHCSEVNMWQHSEKVLSWMSANNPDFSSQSFQFQSSKVLSACHQAS